MSRSADAVVIGGGVNGCSIAYELKQAGLARVVLVERRHIASGPTGRSVGIIRQHYTREAPAAMARDSLEVFRHFSERVGGSAGFRQTGAAFLVPPEGVEELKRTVAMQQRIGIDARLLSLEEVRELEPALSTEGVAACAYEPGSGHADPSLAATSYAEAAREAGVEIRQKTTVTGLEAEGGKIALVRTDKGDLTTGAVVNVAGPWGDEIARMVGGYIPLRATRHAVVVLLRPEKWRAPTPIWYDMIQGVVLKPEAETTLSVAPILPVPEVADIEAYAELPSYDETEKCSELAARRIPVLAEGAAQSGWAGLYDETPDSQPVIDRVPHLENFFCAVGFSGHGFKLAPAVGKVMAELVTTGRCSRYDIGMFRYTRFEEGQSSAGAYRYGILG